MRKCDCGGSAIMIQDRLKPYGFDYGFTQYYYKCPLCGHRTVSGSTGTTCLGDKITEERAKEIALEHWEEDYTIEKGRKALEENSKRFKAWDIKYYEDDYTGEQLMEQLTERMK